MPLRILHVTPSVGPHRGGPSFVLRTVARGLARMGVAVDVASTDDDGAVRLQVPLNTCVEQEGVRYFYFPRQTSFYNCSLPMLGWLNRRIRDYDLVHIHAVFSYAPSIASWVSLKNRIPYIVRPLGILNEWGMRNRRPLLKKLSFRYVERRILENAAAVHYTSEQERAEAARLIFRGKDMILPNPVDLGDPAAERGAFRARYPQLKGKTILLFMSRLDPKKGLDLLLPAYKIVHDTCPDAALVIAGNGHSGFHDDLRRLAKQAGVDGRIVWTGFLEGREKQELLADSDIFVLPSYSENFGVAAVEAMGHRLPVVLSNQVALHTAVTQHGAGIITSCETSEIAGALLRLSGNSRERFEMGERGYCLAQTQYSTEAVCREMIAAYQRILSN